MQENNNVELDLCVDREAIKSFANCILPAIQQFYEIEKNNKEFEEWLENKAKQ